MRKLITAFLVSFGLIAVIIAQLTWWVNIALIDTEGFTRTTTEVLRSKAVQDALADEVTRRLNTEGLPPEAAGEVRGAVGAVVAEDSFISAAAAAITGAHTELLDGDKTVSASIDLGQFQNELQTSLADVNPAFAGLVPSANDLGTLDLEFAGKIPDFARQATLVKTVAWLSTIIAIVFLVAAPVISRRRPRTVRNIGIGLLVTPLLPLVLRVVVPNLALGAIHDDNVASIVRALVEAFFASYIRIGLLVGAAGLVLLLVGIVWGRVAVSGTKGPRAVVPTRPVAPMAAPRVPQPSGVRVNPPEETPVPASRTQPVRETAPAEPAQATEVVGEGDAAKRKLPDTSVDDVGWSGSDSRRPHETP